MELLVFDEIMGLFLLGFSACTYEWLMLIQENWDRFLPQFKKRNVQRKKVRKAQKKEKSLFPPPQTPRKEDLLMESGEYFITTEEKEASYFIG